MGTFITQEETPTLYADKAPAPGQSLRPGWSLDNVPTADNLNDLKAALLDTREYLRGPIDIRQFGGVPDGATDCLTALNTAAGNAGYAGVVRLPKIHGTANTYYFSAFIPANFSGITLDVDDGVTLSIASDEIMSSMARAIRFTRPTRFYWRSFGRAYRVSNADLLLAATPPPTKDLWVDEAAYNRARYAAVLCNTSEVVARKISWNASDTWVADTFATTTAKSFRLAAGVSDGAFHVGLRGVVPGDEVCASFGSIVGSPFLVGMLRTKDGYVGVFCSADDAAATLQRVVKTTGVAGTSSALGPVWQGNHASYAPKNAVWALRVDGPRRCALLLNGYVLTTWATSGDIYEAGFGYFPNAASDEVTVRDVVVARNKRPTHGTILSVGVVGDSRSAPRLDCWPDFLPHALEYTGGVRAWKVQNLAVAGENSAQQLARYSAAGAASFDVTVIDIGTNDVQGGVAVATFLANVTAMVDACLAAGKACVLVNFDLWYGHPQTAFTGQDATNYAAGAPYRSALLRLAAEKGVTLIDSPSVTGPMLAHYVNPALGVDLTAAGDPSLSDNIHPTTALNRLRAREVARAICGALMPEGGSVTAPALHVGTAGAAPLVLSGTGTPEAVVTAPVGSLYLRTDGGASTTLYVKQSGTGATGWTAK